MESYTGKCNRFMDVTLQNMNLPRIFPAADLQLLIFNTFSIFLIPICMMINKAEWLQAFIKKISN